MSPVDHGTSPWTTARPPAAFDAGITLMSRTACAAIILMLALVFGGEVIETGTLGGHWALSALLTGTGAIAVAVLVSLGAAARSALTRRYGEVTATVDALARGDYTACLPASTDDATSQLSVALGQLAAQMRVNTDSARLLAAGSFWRAAQPVAPADPIGAALAQATRRVEEMALAAQRIARGDLATPVEVTSEEDALGRAHAAMVNRVATTIRDAEEGVRRLAREADDLCGEAAALAAAVDSDADQLRHGLGRITHVAIQARSDADRGVAMAEQLVDSELLLNDGTAAWHRAADALRDVLSRAESVQRLARHAGLLAVYSSADVTQGTTPRSGGALPLESEARSLAQEAASVATSMTRMMIDGTEQVHASGVALDQVTLALRTGTAVSRATAATVRLHAAELMQADEQLVKVHGAMTKNAAGARRLSTRLEMFSSHVRLQEAALRRLDRGRIPLLRDARTPGDAARPELYRTPPHTHVALPRLAVMGV